MHLLGKCRETGCLIETDLTMNKYSWLVALAPLALMACSNNNDNNCPGGPHSCLISTFDIVSSGELVKNLTWSGSACETAQMALTGRGIRPLSLSLLSLMHWATNWVL